MFTITGLIEMANTLTGLSTEMQQKIPMAIYRQGERVMTRSKEEFVPVEFGVLKNSGHVQEPELTGTQWSVTLAYGGPAAPYALIQHETPWYHHPVGQWKYLETPLLEAAGDGSAAANIAADLGWGS